MNEGIMYVCMYVCMHVRLLAHTSKIKFWPYNALKGM
jgi:hypothetical protein